MKKDFKKLVLPLIILLSCGSCIFFLPPTNLEIIIAVIILFLTGIILLFKFFFPFKYACLGGLFLAVFLALGLLKVFDPINILLLVSLCVGSIILIK